MSRKQWFYASCFGVLFIFFCISTVADAAKWSVETEGGLQCDFSANICLVDKPLKAKNNGIELYAQRAKIELKQKKKSIKKLTLLEQVLIFGAKGEAVRAAHVVYDIVSGLVTASRENAQPVILWKNDQILTASRITFNIVKHLNGKTEFKNIKATGGVTLSTPDAIIKGKSARMSLSKDIIYVDHQITIRDQKALIQGSHLTYNQQLQKIKLNKHGHGKQTQAIIFPDSFDQ